VAESLPGHDRVGGERAVDDPEQVHAEYPAPVLGGQVPGIAPDADAGVVEQVVKPAVAGGGFLDHLPDGVLAGHVDLAPLSPAALADDRLATRDASPELMSATTTVAPRRLLVVSSSPPAPLGHGHQMSGTSRWCCEA
jgi:hypothetical protein